MNNIMLTQICIGVGIALIVALLFGIIKLGRNYFKLIMNKLTLLEMRQNAAHNAWVRVNGAFKGLGESYKKNYDEAWNDEVEEHKIKKEGID